jgi:hypothetical protein
MGDRIKIKEKTLESFETLKYILEVKFGNIISEVQYNIMPGVNDEGLVDLEGDIYIIINYPEPDLSIIASRLKKVDEILNEVFSSYYFTAEGNLVKHRIGEPLMGVSHMLYDLKVDWPNEVIKINLGVIFYDL